MPIKIIRQDITKIKCDAIVDSTDVRCSHGGGADADIHETAGVELYHACAEQGFLEVGKAIITPGFALPCKYVIHTVGPRWHGGENGENVKDLTAASGARNSTGTISAEENKEIVTFFSILYCNNTRNHFELCEA